MDRNSRRGEMIWRFAGRMDVVGGPLFLIGLFLKYLYPDQGSVLVVIGLSLLSYSSVLKAFLRDEKDNKVERVLRKAFHIVISTGVLSILYIVQRWPGIFPVFTVFGAGSLVGTGIALFTRIRFFKLVDFNEKLKFGSALVFYLMAFIIGIL